MVARVIAPEVEFKAILVVELISISVLLGEPTYRPIDPTLYVFAIIDIPLLLFPHDNEVFPSDDMILLKGDEIGLYAESFNVLL